MPYEMLTSQLGRGLSTLELHLGCGRLGRFGFGWLEAIPRRLSP